VQSRYLFQGPGGDQFAGRAATGLDVNDFAFSALPPHFNEVNGPVLTTAEWEDILTGYSSFYPQSLCHTSLRPSAFINLGSRELYRHNTLSSFIECGEVVFLIVCFPMCALVS
jgi:hypothetical protein